MAEMADTVVSELHEHFAFYLAAIHRLDGDVLHLVAGRGELAGVINEFLLVEQSVETVSTAASCERANAAHRGHTAGPRLHRHVTRRPTRARS